MLHILNIPKLGHTIDKNVCSRLTLGKMCSNIERCVFRALSMGALFYLGGFNEKVFGFGFNNFNCCFLCI